MRGDGSRSTAYDLLEKKGIDTDKLGMVGRLDVDTSGVLLFTDDYKVHGLLTRPGGKEKVYIVTCYGRRKDLVSNSPDFSVNCEVLEEEMKRPLCFSHNSMLLTTKPAKQVSVERTWKGDAPWCDKIPDMFSAVVRIVIDEGKHHQIRRIVARSKLKILKLHRRSIATTLTDALVPNPGDVHELTHKESRELRRAFVEAISKEVRTSGAPTSDGAVST